VHDVLALRHVLEVDQAGVQPLVVRLLSGELGLDLLVLDDPVLVGVDEEHLAGLEPALAHDRGGVEVEYADLGGQDDEPVVGDPVARGAQAVAVEYGADLRAVGEDDTGRAVPRLHHRGVELVEGPPLGVHLAVVLPGLRDHHEYGVGQAAAAHVQQLEHLVERGGVGGTRRTDRVDALEVAGNQVGLQQRLAGPHPVAVAHHGVDLAVVRDEPERVRQRPARERVGGEPRVHHGQRRGDALVDQVGEDVVELVGGQHALVGQRAARQRREVDVGLALGALAEAERQPLQRHAAQPRAGAGHEELAERRHDRLGGLAEAVGYDGHLAPAEHAETLFGRDLLDPGLGLGDRLGAAGQERGAHGVEVVSRQVEVDHGAQERVGDLHQDPGAVTRVGLGPRCATVFEVAQRGQRLGNDVVAGHTGQGRHEGHTTRVVLVAAVVQPLWLGASPESRSCPRCGRRE